MEGQTYVPMAGDAHGSSATCARVLVGLELQLYHGVQSNLVHKRPAKPTGVRGWGCALAAHFLFLRSVF